MALIKTGVFRHGKNRFTWHSIRAHPWTFSHREIKLRQRFIVDSRVHAKAEDKTNWGKFWQRSLMFIFVHAIHSCVARILPECLSKESQTIAFIHSLWFFRTQSLDRFICGRFLDRCFLFSDLFEPELSLFSIIQSSKCFAFLYRKDIELLQKPTFERSPGDP